MEWVKAFHVISVIAWMAGMLYLPRLFVYHAGAEKGSVQSRRSRSWSGGFTGNHHAGDGFAWIFGLWMVFAGVVDWASGWPM